MFITENNITSAIYYNCRNIIYSTDMACSKYIIVYTRIKMMMMMMMIIIIIIIMCDNTHTLLITHKERNIKFLPDVFWSLCCSMVLMYIICVW